MRTPSAAIVERDAIEMQYEYTVALACGMPFTIGVTDAGYAAALLAVDPLLPAVSITC